MIDWKDNTEQVLNNFRLWWKGEGMILSSWDQGYALPENLRRAAEDPVIRSLKEKYTNPETVAIRERYTLSKLGFPADILPFAYTDWGTVSAAPFFGSPMNYGDETVWYEPVDLSPENDRKLFLADDNPWYLTLQNLVTTGKKIAGGDYLTGMPSLCPGLDVLSELCGASELCMYLITDPEWVHRKLDEITAACLKAYEIIYHLASYDDGSAFVSFFRLWAPGRVSLIQNDFSSLISESMFREFAIPFIREFSAAMDHSLFHVDGPEAIRTVDALLEIENLTSLQFTPGPQVPGGGDARWFELYRKVKEAGKRMQIVWMKAEDVIPLLDAVGPKGLYLMVDFRSLVEAENLAREVEPYRKS